MNPPASVLARFLLGLAALMMAQPWAACGAGLPSAPHHFDQDSATISFGLTLAGFLHPRGEFQRFEGDFSIDPADLGASRVSVRLDGGAVDVSLPGGDKRLRSADYFDAGRFPDISFRSTQVAMQASGHIQVRGILTIRGIDRPQTLDAIPPGASTEAPSDDFVIHGRIARSDFGMTADRPLVSDDIELTIRVRLPAALAGQ